MAEDDDISRRYRELPPEEPPRHLDDAIRAAARRAVLTRPAPLVVPTGRQRWYFPLAAAAIIVLAVAVTLHVEREQPGEELVTAPAAPAGSPAAPREVMREEAQAEKSKPAPQPERRRKTESADARQLRDAAPPAPAAPPPPPPVTAQDAIRAEESAAGAFMGSAEPAPKASSSSAARSESAARQSSALAKLAVVPSPEQWLQGIADLRRQARHEEADKALAEFRKRYPRYRIPEAMLEKVERR